MESRYITTVTTELEDQNNQRKELQDHTDKELFALVAGGDELAFKILFDRYVPQLVHFLRRLTGRSGPCEEIVQETFLRIWLSRDKLEGVEYPKTWLFQVAAHVCYSWLRKHIAYQDAMARYTRENEVALLEEDADHTIRLAETRQLIQAAVSKLPPKRRRIFILSREHGLTIPEVAQRLGISPHTVKNTLVKALSEIRDAMAKAGYGLPAWLIYLIWLNGG
ncbi:MAG TPA: sigma-70 family RNA polymerase sigma factor [Phnomibacter sp.]|nr:sigma-70 family RNA polymerase sigma factor [Phnomibacter sp.]